MHILKRDPGKGYYGASLWLPRRFHAERQIKGTLVYDNGKNTLFNAYQEEPEHYVVPRNYIPEHALSQMPYPVLDARVQKFPRVQIQSKVVLDFQNPAETHQREAAAALLNANNGILCLRCGAGKTVVAIHALCQLEVPTLVIVNDLGLAQQWLDALLDFTNLTEDEVGFLGAGQFRWQHKVTIALAQTLAGRVRDGKLPRELVEHFGVVIADEAHTTGGPAFYHLSVTPFHGRRWGLSATPRRTDGYDSLLRYTLGPVVYRYLIPELIPAIYFRRLPTKLNVRDPIVAKAVCDRSGELHAGKVYGYLATRDDRTDAIVKEIREAIKQGRQVLVLSQSRAMLDRLHQSFPDAGLVHGGVKDRKERHRRVRECNPVITIARLGRQALDKPKLDTLLLCEPYTDSGVLQQIMGRVQRKDPNKQQPLIVIYEDSYIKPMHAMCKRIRRLLSRWPDDMGGRLHWQNVGDNP